ncbi:patatin-like phospholipase family protein [Albimonas sp. CAU 1670]|uniref:patatin-like phospholipase family protein n=1 Tax=Albimonas sp. CAU 1670 TaxID=3032599 RepID=UPI0023DA820E|nr:patatin-like phospholipase family protein [Albimonas sp. CAU 1670]MDF2232339.1 patatin-like phospholipase family protein [Albimonas sp. CAU 1670]
MARRKTKTINLALQGGGAHGAFTWGVLDRLLEEEALEFDGITATSAGAMNAAALKTGLLLGGSREAAKASLDSFWGSIARYSSGLPNPLLEWVRAFNPTTENLADAIEAGASWGFGDSLTRMFSPYDLNPFNINPLRDLLTEQLHFDTICNAEPPHLFICATNVRSGKARVFSGDEISSEAILASTCLPSLFQAVEIDDPTTGRREAYWDGGFTGNPSLWPLFYGTTSRDVVIVHINPIEREELPRTARDIINRTNEISFNAALLGELRAVTFVRRLLAEGVIPEGAMKDVLIHSIADDETMRKLGAATKMKADWTLVRNLKQVGREAAERFLQANWSNLGERPSVDLRALYSA